MTVSHHPRNPEPISEQTSPPARVLSLSPDLSKMCVSSRVKDRHIGEKGGPSQDKGHQRPIENITGGLLAYWFSNKREFKPLELTVWCRKGISSSNPVTTTTCPEPFFTTSPLLLGTNPQCTGHVSTRSTPHPFHPAIPTYVAPPDRFGKTLCSILLMYPSLLPWESRRSCAGGVATMYKSIMEHIATVIICEKNPNVSERGVNPQTGIWGLDTYQGISRTEANRHREPGGPGWSG